jgi:hypothetical protein
MWRRADSRNDRGVFQPVKRSAVVRLVIRLFPISSEPPYEFVTDRLPVDILRRGFAKVEQGKDGSSLPMMVPSRSASAELRHK